MTFKSYYSKHKKTIIIVTVLIVLYHFIFAPSISLFRLSKNLPSRIKPIKAALVNQDVELLIFELDYLREYLEEIDKETGKLRVLSVVPYFGSYFSDLKTVSSLSLDLLDTSTDLFTSLEQAIPNLNFKGWGLTEDFLTEDSVDTNLSQVTAVLSDELPNYKERFWIINKKLSSIKPDRYPEEIRGVRVRYLLREFQTFSFGLITSFDDIATMIKLGPDLFGETGVRNYLVFLQNDKELRPSGGVLSSYAVFTVSRGNLKLTKSGDVAFLDNSGVNYLKPPQFISQYLGINRFHIRDAAFSPDFKESAEAIRNLWANAPDTPQIDGVIVLDTHFISSLLDILGEVEVADYGVFTNENVTEEMQKFFTSSGSHMVQDKERKDIMGVFLYELMRQTFSASSIERVEILSGVLQEARQKHFLVHLINNEAQEVLNKYDFTGRVKDYDGDYIYISDSNVGGDRSNLYVVERVKKAINKVGNKVVSTVTIEYENTADYNETYNRVYKNYVRVYVPKGSKLISSDGSQVAVTQGDILGKTFFAGFLEVKPKSKNTYVLKYELPSSTIREGAYKLLIQKQPGVASLKYEVQIGDKIQEFNLLTDKEIKGEI